VIVFVDIDQQKKIDDLSQRIEKIEIEEKYGTLPSPTGNFPDDPRLKDEKKIMSIYQ
jgi:hypothetical protein